MLPMIIHPLCRVKTIAGGVLACAGFGGWLRGHRLPVDDLCGPVEFLSDEQAASYGRLGDMRLRGEMRRCSRRRIRGGRIGRWGSPGFCARSGVRPARRAAERGSWRPAGRGSAVPDRPETLFAAADSGPFCARLGPRRRR
jgi:hypothetical protein